MFRMLRVSFIALAILLFVGYGISHYTVIENRDQAAKKRIVCTTSLIGDAVRRLVGDTCEVVTLMGPGVDPHLYRMKEGDAHLLARADIIFYNGLHLEGKMTDVLDAIAHARVYAVTRVLSPDQLIVAHGDALYDPHVWHAVPLWKKVIEGIAQVLSTEIPQHHVLYQEQLENYTHELNDLEQWIHGTLGALPSAKRRLVTAHDAFNYFGKFYDFVVSGLQGISTDADISTRDVQQLADYIVAHDIKAIFVESSIAPRAIQAVQYAVHARSKNVIIGGSLYSDALGDEQSGAATYSAMMRSNIQTIVTALTAESKSV